MPQARDRLGAPRRGSGGSGMTALSFGRPLRHLRCAARRCGCRSSAASPRSPGRGSPYMPPRRSSIAGMSKVLFALGISEKPSVDQYCHRRSSRRRSAGPAAARAGRSRRHGWGTTGWPRCPAPSPTIPMNSSTAPHDAGTRRAARRAAASRRAAAASAAEQLRAGPGEQRENERGHREHPPGHAHPVPTGDVVVQQPVRVAAPVRTSPMARTEQPTAPTSSRSQSARVHRRSEPRRSAPARGSGPGKNSLSFLECTLADPA